MKIYTIFTDTHKYLLYNYFLPTLYEHEYTETVIKKIDQICSSGSYGQNGWFETMRQKALYCLQACKDNYGQKIIYADCDIQFLGPFINRMEEELSDYDIACQDDVFPFGNRRTYCAGLLICRANDRTIQLFQNIINLMNMRGAWSPNWDDQGALNENIHITKHKALSHQFYTIAQSKAQLWDNDYSISIPKNILVHHANWTHGVDNKIKLLDFVKREQK